MRAVQEGRADLGEVRDALSEKDRHVLEAPIAPVSWIPMTVYSALLDYLMRIEGGADRAAYLRGRGARACDRLLDGAYRAYKTEPGTWGKRTGEAMMGIGKLLYNFTRWSFRALQDGITYQILCHEARDLPESAVHTAHGFIQRYAENAAGRRVEVHVERPQPDSVVFTVRAPR